MGSTALAVNESSWHPWPFRSAVEILTLPGSEKGHGKPVAHDLGLPGTPSSPK